MIQTALELDFADGTYLFDLKLPQLAELQEKRGCGVFKIYARVLAGRYVVEGYSLADSSQGESYAEDLFETIRLGLIGGGQGEVDGREIKVTAITARRLVDTYCLPAPLRESWSIAAAVLGARIEGYSPPGEDSAGESPAESPATESTSDSSSPTAG